MRVICDIETDSLNPTVIWCIVCKDIDNGTVYSFYDTTLLDFVQFSRRVTCWIGHNFLGFDLWAINKLIDGVKIDAKRCIDTLVCSRLFNYSIPGGHSLEEWGKRLSCPKSSFHDFSHFSGEMLKYCIQDVEVTYKLYKFFEPHLSKDEWRSALRTEHDMAVICHDMHTTGFAFNYEEAQNVYRSISVEVESLAQRMEQSLLPRARAIREICPRETKHGTLNRSDFRWVTDGDLSPYQPGSSFTRIEWVEFNPGSPKQVVDRLNEAGWAPFERTKGHVECIREIGQLERELRQRPTSRDRSIFVGKRLADLRSKLTDFEVYGWKVSEENLATLPPDAPEAVWLLIRWRFAAKRKQTLEEWFKAYDKDTGRIHGSFSHIGAWTERMSHSGPNMGNVPSTASKYHSPELKALAKDYGVRMRSLWTVPKGKRLVGVDAEGIQLRVLAHYMDDKEFTHALVSGTKEDGTDAHTLNAIKLGIGKERRENAKTFIYAFLLGAGIDKLSKILHTNRVGAQDAYDSFLDGYPGLANLKYSIIPDDAKRGYFVGLDGRFVPCTSEHLMLAGYLQNGESVVMKRANIMWRNQLIKERVPFKQVNFVHDEWQTETEDDDDIANYVAQVQMNSIKQVGIDLGLRCPLSGSSSIGYNWYETH